MAERVIVAVDGGPASVAALAWAVDRAKTVDTHVEIVAVAGMQAGPPVEVNAGYRGPYGDVLLDAKQLAVTELPGLDVIATIRWGNRLRELVDASRDADLLVIGSNTTSPIVGIVHGTLSLRVAGRAECPTIVVPASWQRRAGRVVVGWSDDPVGDAALDFAAREASRRRAGLTIVHTLGAPAVSTVDSASAAHAVQEDMAAHRALLDGAARRVRSGHPDLAVMQAMHTGSAAVAIVRASADASLVVVGSRGRGPIADIFLGSVSYDVLINMPAPVAVISIGDEPIQVYPETADEVI